MRGRGKCLGLANKVDGDSCMSVIYSNFNAVGAVAVGDRVLEVLVKELNKTRVCHKIVVTEKYQRCKVRIYKSGHFHECLGSQE